MYSHVSMTTITTTSLFIFSGAPAAGKGTQCAFIKERFGVVHLSTGDMLRAAVAAETQIGQLAKDFMDSGKLVPDDVMIGIVSHCHRRGRRCNSMISMPKTCSKTL